MKFLNSTQRRSDFILKLKGGSDELNNEQQERLVKSILARTPESDLNEISINKLLKKLLEIIDPVISDQRFWKILTELERPDNFNMIQTTNQLTSYNLKPYEGFRKVTDDFENRLTK